MKYNFLAFCFYSLFLHAEINFLDRIAIIVDDGIIMESELNEALENTINNFEERGERLPPRDIIFSRVMIPQL